MKRFKGILKEYKGIFYMLIGLSIIVLYCVLPDVYCDVVCGFIMLALFGLILHSNKKGME